jgi:hypothetical protein
MSMDSSWILVSFSNSNNPEAMALITVRFVPQQHPTVDTFTASPPIKTFRLPPDT